MFIDSFIKDLKEYIFKVDLKGRIIFISEKFLAKLEIKAEEYIDEDLSKLLSPGSQTILKTILKNLHQIKLISQIFLEFKIRSGTTIFFKCDFSKILFKKETDFILVFCEEIVVDNFIAKELQKYQLIANQKNQLFYDYDTNTLIGRVFGDLSILSGVNLSHDNEININEVVEKIHPDDRERIIQILQDEWKNNALSSHKYRLQTKSGRYINIESINHVVTNDEGKNSHVFGILRSIPKGDYLSLNLESNQSQIQTIYENISEVIWEIKPDMSLKFISSNINKVLGWDSSEIVDNKTNIVDLIHPNDKIHYQNSLNKLVSQSKLYNIEYRIKHKDESWRWIHDRAIDVISGADGKIFYGMLVDISEKKKIEEIYLNTLKVRSLEYFTKGIAYELDIISSNIHANVLLLEKIITKTPETSVFCKQLQQKTTNITSIAETLFLKKVKYLTPELNKNLVEIIKNAVNTIVQDYNIESVYSFDDKIWNIKIKYIYLIQIIEFLTYRAMNDMLFDGIINIDVRNLILEKENDFLLEGGLYVKIEISDKGLGLSKEEIFQLSNPISQFDFETPKLGLQILRYFILSQEGKLNIESRFKHGTSYIVILPAFK
jgi:PAS domain S-box-containing protein